MHSIGKRSARNKWRITDGLFKKQKEMYMVKAFYTEGSCPQSLREKIMGLVHNEGHFDGEKRPANLQRVLLEKNGQGCGGVL